MIQFTLKNKPYQLISHYMEHTTLRNSLNTLTRKIYGFDFEKWYQSGYWTKTCIFYSLFDGDTAVSHITVSVINFDILTKPKRFVQLGTVMTDPKYRNQGLSRILIEHVLSQWYSQCDMIYLFANDSVLDFYPKFGFTSVSEYQASKRITHTDCPYAVRKLDISNPYDRELLVQTTQNAVPLFQLSAVNNTGLIMFYCYCLDSFSFGESLFYIAGLNAVAVAEYKEDTLILYDVFSEQSVDINTVLTALATAETTSAVLKCMPYDIENYTIAPVQEEDSTLFVLGSGKSLFEHRKLIFPILSHT